MEVGTTYPGFRGIRAYVRSCLEPLFGQKPVVQGYVSGVEPGINYVMEVDEDVDLSRSSVLDRLLC